LGPSGSLARAADLEEKKRRKSIVMGPAEASRGCTSAARAWMGDLVVAASSFLQAGTVVTASAHECGAWDVKQDGEKKIEMGSVLWLLSGGRWLDGCWKGCEIKAGSVVSAAAHCVSFDRVKIGRKKREI
jgi:hypothetical protein